MGIEKINCEMISISEGVPKVKLKVQGCTSETGERFLRIIGGEDDLDIDLYIVELYEKELIFPIFKLIDDFHRIVGETLRKGPVQ